VVLGGSRARGSHTSSSDVDLGLYYHAGQPIDLEALEWLTAQLDDEGRRSLVTPFGGWGPWINGGGWLKVQGVPVDFLYRELDKVSAVIEACRSGQVDIYYQAGHPHGFLSAIYLAEIAVCRVLWEKDDCVTHLKQQALPYPQALKQALVQKFAWEVNFHLGGVYKGISRLDRVYTAGCAFRVAACMTQVLFAINEQYWLNEKGAAAVTESFAIKPRDFRTRLEAAFSGLGGSPAEMEQAAAELESLSAELDRIIQG
jgi:hypothetical protein